MHISIELENNQLVFPENNFVYGCVNKQLYQIWAEENPRIINNNEKSCNSQIANTNLEDIWLQQNTVTSHFTNEMNHLFNKKFSNFK